MKGVNNMAEFCLECWRRLNEKDYPPEMYVLSRELDLCEGCGEYKNVIVRVRSPLGQQIMRAFLDLKKIKRNPDR